MRFQSFPAMTAGLYSLIALPVTHTGAVTPIVEIEEIVYQYTPANNGAGPMWCHGSTSIATIDDRVLVTGLETLNEAKPLNNCRWFLMERTDDGWKRIYTDTERTREPSPLTVFSDGRLFVSANPTLVEDPNRYSGPSKPEVLEFALNERKGQPTKLAPYWDGAPQFTEHSYRSFAADPISGELLLLQNIGYTHAEWSFRDRTGLWSSQGQLVWPTGTNSQPIRICYPNVAVNNRAVYFCGVSDILEPNPEWRAYKHELTGQKWDYDFRRLFFTWSPDIGKEGFGKWVEVSSRDETAGWISPGDLWVAPDGDVHLLWTERAIDERLRKRFFPNARQRHGLYYAVIRDGMIRLRRTLLLAEEDGSSTIPGRGRFHVAGSGELFVVCAVNRNTPDGRIWENWLIPMQSNSVGTQPLVIPLEHAFTDFFTATPRAGSPTGGALHLYGPQAGQANSMGYARIRLD